MISPFFTSSVRLSILFDNHIFPPNEFFTSLICWIRSSDPKSKFFRDSVVIILGASKQIAPSIILLGVSRVLLSERKTPEMPFTPLIAAWTSSGVASSVIVPSPLNQPFSSVWLFNSETLAFVTFKVSLLILITSLRKLYELGSLTSLVLFIG